MFNKGPRRDGSLASMSALHAVDRGFELRPGDTKDNYKIMPTVSLPCAQVFGLGFGSATRLCKKPSIV